VNILLLASEATSGIWDHCAVWEIKGLDQGKIKTSSSAIAERSNCRMGLRNDVRCSS